MQIFIEVLKLLAVTLAPGLVALFIYILDKKVVRIKYLNKYIKGIAIGIIFTVLTMLPFYCGMDYMKVFTFDYEVKGNFGPITASPLIASVIFGWPAGLTAGLLGFLWRALAAGVHVIDYLRFSDSIAILVASLIGVLITKFISKKNSTPKWTYGIVLGLIVESIHMLLIYPIVTIKYNDLNFAHQIINNAGWVSFVSTVIAVVLAFLWINLYNKQKVRIFSRQTRLSSNIQKRLILFFTLAIVVTFATTGLVSYFKAYSDAYSDLVVSNEDVVNEIIDSTETKGLHKLEVIQAIVSNRRIRTYGFIVIASAKDQKVIEPENELLNEPEEIQTYKDQILAVPNYATSYINKYLYFNHDSTYTAAKTLTRAVTFKDKNGKEMTCSASSLLTCFVHSDELDKDYKYLIQVIKTNPVKGEGTNEYYVCAFLTMDEAVSAVVLSMRISMYFEILVYSFVYLLIYRFIKKKVVDNIDSVNKSLNRISAGKLNTKVNVRGFDEFSSLSDDVNQTVDVLKDYIKQANKRIDDELHYAKTIQMNSIPLVFPISKYFDLHANMVTAKQVGGDFYDFFFIDDRHLFFMVADVSGKGIPAAMFMMRAKTLVNALAQTKELTLDQIIDNVNDELNVDNKSGMFVTAFAGILDTLTGKLEYVNAGHTRPLIIKKNRRVSLLSMKPNTVLGVFSGFKYTLESTILNKGDQIIVYTDGVTEATNKKKQLYGEKRLMNLFKNHKHMDSRESIDLLNKELMTFQKGAEQADDITILSLIYKNNK